MTDLRKQIEEITAITTLDDWDNQMSGQDYRTMVNNLVALFEKEREELVGWVETFIGLAQEVAKEARDYAGYDEDANELYTIADITICSMKFREKYKSLQPTDRKDSDA